MGDCAKAATAFSSAFYACVVLADKQSTQLRQLVEVTTMRVEAGEQEET